MGMLENGSGVIMETVTPILASSRLVFSIERTTPLTCGCQASVTMVSLGMADRVFRNRITGLERFLQVFPANDMAVEHYSLMSVFM